MMIVTWSSPGCCAMDAQVVVINHHLFFADMAVKDTGFGELVPEAQVYVFDEAHQLPEIASHYFSASRYKPGSRTIQDLAQDIQLAYRAEAHDMAQLGKAADRLAIASQDLRLAFGVEGARQHPGSAETIPLGPGAGPPQ